MVIEEFADGLSILIMLVYFAAVCGLSGPTGAEYLPPSRYTSKLAGLIYCTRLVVLERVLPRALYDYVNIRARPRQG